MPISNGNYGTCLTAGLRISASLPLGVLTSTAAWNGIITSAENCGQMII